MKDLIDKVRTTGYVEFGQNPSLRDNLPFLYSGESDPSSSTALPYYNSGGRSIVFERAGICYRLKGVDPTGKLTKRVADSKTNRLADVNVAYEKLRRQTRPGLDQRDLMFAEGKPFGLFFFNQAESEKNAFARLASVYEQLEIENPCEFLSYPPTGAEVCGEKTYQTAFRLPRIEADLRAHEFIMLLADRLDHCSADQIAKKTRNINRLFGRLISWIGANTIILTEAGLLPTTTSFHPQNWVISKYEQGYGIFRVDHTSTNIVSKEEAFKSLTTRQCGTIDAAHNFSIFPSRVQIAADPIKFFPKGSRDLRFSELLCFSRLSVDERALLAAHKTAFVLGMQSLASTGRIDPIPEEMFREALE